MNLKTEIGAIKAFQFEGGGFQSSLFAAAANLSPAPVETPAPAAKPPLPGMPS